MIANAQVKKPDYYSKDFMKDDYYNKSNKQSEGIGKWNGKASKTLGLEGDVKQKDFWNVLKGINPNTEQKLSKYIRNEPKDYGQDFVFDTNKYYGMLLQVFPEGSKEHDHLKKGWDNSTNFGREEIEKRLTTREGSQYKPVAGAVIATWEHETSREEAGKIDFQKHSHNVFANFAQNEKGQWKSVDFKRAFEDKLLIASQMQAMQAKTVQELGFKIKEGKTGWEIEGINKEVVDYFSGRSNKIKQDAQAKNDTSFQSRQNSANIKTKKGDYDLQDLQNQWKETLDTKFGINPKSLNLIREAEREPKKEISIEEILRKTCALSRGANFTEKHLDIALAQKSQTHDFDIDKMKSEILDDDGIIKTQFKDKQNNELMFNTKHVSKEHKEFMQEADKSSLQIKKCEAQLKSMPNARNQPKIEPKNSDSGDKDGGGMSDMPSEDGSKPEKEEEEPKEQPTPQEAPKPHQTTSYIPSGGVVSNSGDFAQSLLICQNSIDNIQNQIGNLDHQDPDNLEQINLLRIALSNAKSQLLLVMQQQSSSEHQAQMQQISQQAKQQNQLQR